MHFDELEQRIPIALKDSKEKRKLMCTYTNPPPHIFNVRGPEYLKLSKGQKNVLNLKIPSKESPYTLIGVNMYESPVKITHSVKQIGVINRHFESHPPDKPDAVYPRFLVINWLLNSLFRGGYYVVQHVFELADPNHKDEAQDTAFLRFKNSDEAGKNSQLKFIVYVVDAPYIVRKTINGLGGEKPVLIANRVKTTYQTGKNHLEINMDVSSSRIASMMIDLLLKNMENCLLDCAWLMEGQKDEELPERVLSKIRWAWNSVEMVLLKLDEGGELIPEGRLS